jgi:MoaA/NifB/PqqE/SkfB family radical SAM enzyme
MATLSQKTKLLWGMLTGKARTGPLFVDVDLTSRCNLQCLGCPYHSPMSPGAPTHSSRGDIPFDLVMDLLKELKELDTRSLVLQGEGEPFLYPHLPGLVAAAKEAGFFITLLTNGTLLDREIVLSLVSSRLDLLKVTLWASSPAQYEKNYPGTNPDYFQRVVEGMKQTARLKAEQGSDLPLLVLHHPINRHNFQTLPSVVDLASRAGCNGVSFSPFYPLEGRLKDCLLSKEEELFVCRTLKEMKEKATRLGLRHNIDETLLRYRVGEAVWETMPCYVPWYHARVRVDGAVQPCGRCRLTLGNLKKETFGDVWKGPDFRKLRLHGMNAMTSPVLREHCDCDFCCFVKDDLHVHRVFRYFAPFRMRSMDHELQNSK